MMTLQYDNNKAYLHQNSYDSKDHRSYSNSYQKLNSYILDNHNTIDHHINNDTNTTNNNNNRSSINSEKIESNGSEHSQSYSDCQHVLKSNNNTTATATNNYNNNFNDNNNNEDNNKHKYDTSDTIHNNDDVDEITSSLSYEEESSIAVAIFEIGLKNSSPKILMPLMPHDSSLNTEHVKSHLQKYRIHRQRSRDEFHDFYHDFIKDDYYKWLQNRIYSSCSSNDDININHISNEVITCATANTNNNDSVYHLLNGVLVPDSNLLYNNYIISNDNKNVVTTNMINYHYNQTVTPVGPLTSSSSSQINSKKRNLTNVNSDGDISVNYNNYHIDNNITDNNHYYNSTDHNAIMNNYSTYIAEDDTMNQLHQFNYNNIEHHHNNYITATVTNNTQMELLNDSEQVLKNWIVICNEIITNTETLKKNLEKTVTKVSKP